MRLRSRPHDLPRSLLSGTARTARTALAAAAIATCALAPRSARAADDAATAQALFDEATALKTAGSWEKACPKFESSYKLDPALGTLLNLANCYEKISKIASAWAKWEEAFQWATKNNDDRAEYAKTQRDALAPRLPKLTIVVKNPVAALSIERDTSPVSEAMFGTALPVDPGPHTVFVKRNDELLKTEKITVAEAQSAEVSLDLAAIEKAAPPPPKPKKDVLVVGPSPALRKVGWGVGAAGLAGVLAAGVLEGLALSKKGEADVPSRCYQKLCTAEGKAFADQATGFAEAGQWVGIGSLVIAAVGVTLLIVTPGDVVVKTEPGKEKAAATRPTRDVWATPWVMVAPGGARDGVQIGGGLALGGRL